MHDMTFSTQRKLRLKLWINHCLLMCLHRASSCLALFSSWDLLICKALMFEKGISYRVVYILSYWFVFFQKGVREGVLEKKTLSFDEKLVKQEEVWNLNPERKEDHQPVIKSHNVGSYPTSKLFNVHGYQKEYKEMYW